MKTCASLEVWLDNFKKRNYFRIKQFFATEPYLWFSFYSIVSVERIFCNGTVWRVV